MCRQLTHPLVSPVFQGSLGNLPPLYIIAGDEEVLRDEVIYLAHRAAYPEDYPTREGILRDARRQKENAAKFTKGTKVGFLVWNSELKLNDMAYRCIFKFSMVCQCRCDRWLVLIFMKECVMCRLSSVSPQMRVNLSFSRRAPGLKKYLGSIHLSCTWRVYQTRNPTHGGGARASSVSRIVRTDAGYVTTVLRKDRIP